MDTGPGSVMQRAELRADQRTVVIRRAGRAGLPLRIAVPFDHYRGVSADIHMTERGLICAIILAHADPEFDVMLFRADDDEDILAEWHGWSQRLGLPLMIRTESGDIPARRRLGALHVEEICPRRARRLFLLRRPRFLRARKIGVRRILAVHEECEIIAPQ